jgi:hypothetical protein
MHDIDVSRGTHAARWRGADFLDEADPVFVETKRQQLRV